jgi:hypothetical protein
MNEGQGVYLVGMGILFVRTSAGLNPAVMCGIPLWTGRSAGLCRSLPDLPRCRKHMPGRIGWGVEQGGRHSS